MLFVNPLPRAWRMGFVENGTIWERARAVDYYTANNGGGAGGPGRGKKRSRGGGRGGAGASSGSRSAAAGGGDRAADAVGRGSGGGVRDGRLRGSGGGAAAAAGRIVAPPQLTVEQLRAAQNALPATPRRGTGGAQSSFT